MKIFTANSNSMKRLIKSLGICLLCFIFVSCFANPIDFKYKIVDFDNVVSVELIRYNNSDVKNVRDYKAHPDFDFSKVEHIETMEEEKYENLFTVLASTLILNHVSHNNSPGGISVIITYENGDFDILSAEYAGRFSSSGNFIKFLGRFDEGNEWFDNNIIKNHFEQVAE
ncbi:MAG: hypothetical protein FWD48_11895 [Oscillospiraceae bacterium]|nr:hypothetical protein [Oscillospiraceae bacterium]